MKKKESRINNNNPNHNGAKIISYYFQKFIFAAEYYIISTPKCPFIHFLNPQCAAQQYVVMYVSTVCNTSDE